ncbi:DUF2971 domain-containing protein [Candidatus Binatus sp.]|uniref:DUF2971 domain-containing protein n=1 Tax=Candidatus Binatus sp. TaxID=2811406 RepID=UPI003F95D5DA
MDISDAHNIENNFIRLTGNEPIYRIFSTRLLLEMFKMRTNVLVRPKCWRDPFENFILKAVQKLPTGERAHFVFKDHVYGQCWSLHNETDAMWRIYSKDEDGVKVKTTVRNLFQSLYDVAGNFRELGVFIGKVAYRPEPELLDKLTNTSFVIRQDGSGIAESLLMKRIEFEHEEEVRLLYTDPEQKWNADLFTYSMDPFKLFDEIIFDPRMEETQYKQYKEGLVKLGFTNTISQSGLYKIRDFEANLRI